MISFRQLLMGTGSFLLICTFSMSGEDISELKAEKPVPIHISEILAAAEKALLAADERMKLKSRKFSIQVYPNLKENENNSWIVKVQPLPARPGGHMWIDLEDSGEMVFTPSFP